MIELTFEARARVGLQYVLDLLSPSSPYGAERVRRPRFFAPAERAELEREWDNVQAAMDGLAAQPRAYERLCHLFMQVRDIRKTLARCRDTVLSEVELYEVKRFLLQLALIVPVFSQIGGAYRGIAFTEEAGALSLLDPDGRKTAGFTIGGAYAKALSEVREEKRRLEMEIRAAADGRDKEALLLQRQLVVAREDEEELRVRAELSASLRPYLHALEKNAEKIGDMDYAIQKARLSLSRGGARPAVCEGGVRFDAMDNPEVADALKARGRAFTRVSIDAPEGCTVITGANMGGKSVALKTLSLNVLLCQAGFFALAKRAQTALFDQVHIVSEDLSDAARGLSSFGAEVLHIERIVSAVKGGAYCFVALDEPARGTNPREGAALVRALVKAFGAQKAVAIVATHYDGVAAAAAARYQAAGLKGLPDAPPPEGDRLSFIARHMDYGLTRVHGDAKTPREALTVCRLLGLDAQVVDEMERALKTGEEGGRAGP